MTSPSAQPLSGRRIAVTRAREQASELATRLAALGAEVIELPLLHVSREISKQDLADVLLELGSYDWIVFTSANGVIRGTVEPTTSGGAVARPQSIQSPCN